MRDVYPRRPALPQDWLVPPSQQPDYVDLPGLEPAAANLGEALSDAHVAAGRGDLVAVVHHESGERVTYAELARRSDRVAATLIRLGLRIGDRVALRGPNRPALVEAAIGAWKAGAVVVPTPAQSRAGELAFFLSDTRPALLLTSTDDDIVGQVPAALAELAGSGDLLPLVLSVGAATPASRAAGFGRWEDALGDETAGPPLPAGEDRPTDDDVAVVWHTGGTTGAPKGCYHTHRRFLMAGYALSRALGTEPGEVWAAAAPMGHALGFIHSTIFTLLPGTTLVLLERFTDPDQVLDAIAGRGVTTFTAIAASWSRLLTTLEARPEGDAAIATLTRGFAMWQSASATAVYAGWLRRGVELLNNFGSTSFATWVLVPHGPGPVPPASLGRPAPGYEVVCLDADGAGVPGRMAVRGPSGLTYWRRPALQTRDVVDGWTLVDDLIQYDDAGFAAYLGRTDLLISTAGYKVAPVEVETVLAAHPAVREVAVLGLPDPERQQIVAAFVAVNDGHEPGDLLRRELQDLVKRELSPYKYPRHVEFVAALPRDHVGKVQPRLLSPSSTPSAASAR
jgi:2-aminobenzoate-CoA ligase